MEILKKLLPFAVALLLASCEYLGFAGYINQLDEIGITHELADAVSFDQHMTSRPREFQGKVYVLGTRGVFAMKADKLTDYEFYPYAQDLGYESDYWSDSLPPINCYRDPASGYVVINSQNTNRGLQAGDTLTLNSDTKTAVFTPYTTHDTITKINDANTLDVYPSGVNDYIFYVYSYDTVLNSTYYIYTTPPEYVITDSMRSSPDNLSIYAAASSGRVTQGVGGINVNIYQLAASDLMATGAFPGTTASVYLNEAIQNDRFVFNYLPDQLFVSLNNRYLLAWGDSLDDGNTMVIYDYTTGERRVKTDLPGSKMFPELGEDGMTVYASSIRGGVARYDYD